MIHTVHGLDRHQNASTARRVGIVVLGLLVTTYLAAITVSFGSQLDSWRRISIFTALWLIGLGAFMLLVRAWRHLRN